MTLNPIVGIIEAVGSIASDLITTDKERMTLEIEALKVDAGIAQSQIETNKIEAASSSFFVAGARPAILWIGAGAMAWTYVAHPMLVWGWVVLQAKGYIPAGLEPPPTLKSDELWVIISGILGLGGYRSFEKIKGVAS